MRGKETTAQPFMSETTGDVLVWNGEVFGGLEVSGAGGVMLMTLERGWRDRPVRQGLLVQDADRDAVRLQIGPDENDGQKLFEQIQCEGPSNFFAAIREIEGPYAFVYYQGKSHIPFGYLSC